MEVLPEHVQAGGLGGKLMTQIMNSGHHAKLAEWGFSLLTVPADANIFDAKLRRPNLGRWLERCPEGHVTGLDYSAVSVETAQKYNRQAIAEGRCAVVQGNVAELPFEETPSTWCPPLRPSTSGRVWNAALRIPSGC